MSVSRPRVQLILDFDGTITIDDTTAVIGTRCLSKARELARADLPKDKLPKSMEHYREQYIEEYREWKHSFTWPSERKTIDDEVSYLSQSKPIEENSFFRVRNAVLGVPGQIGEMKRNEEMRNEFMLDAGRQAVRSGDVRIRDPESLQRLIANTEAVGGVWGIVSVSWSRRFILGALMEAGLVQEEQEDAIAQRISCNELLAPNLQNEEGKPNIICTAQDKLNALNKLLADWKVQEDKQQRQNSLGSRSNPATITIYVGDSSTDIGCLGSPAIGMYMHEGGLEKDYVIETLNKLGVECLRITSLPLSSAQYKPLDAIAEFRCGEEPPILVCLVENFQEINEWFLRMFADSG